MMVDESASSVDQSYALSRLATFLPVVFIALQSLFRHNISSFLGHQFGPSGWTMYYVARVAFIAWFSAALFWGNLPNFGVRPMVQMADEQVRRRYDPLLGLRAMAFLMVFLGHWFMVVFSPYRPATSHIEYVTRAVISASPWAGVWVFFTLSGYLMAKGFLIGHHKLTSDGMRGFYRNRLLRIAPLYLVAIFVVSVLRRPDLLDLSHKAPIEELLSAVTFDTRDGGAIGALWSVCTEFQFYLLVPAAVMVISCAPRRFYVFPAMAALAYFAFGFIRYRVIHIASAPWEWGAYVYYPLLSNLDVFLGGVLAAFVVADLRERGIKLRGGLFLGYLSMAALYTIMAAWSYPEMTAFAGFPGSATRPYFLAFAPSVTSALTFLTICIFEIAERRNPRAPRLWATQAFFGTITYSLYVWHEPVILSLRTLLPSHIGLLSAAELFPLGAMSVLLTALIFYYGVEKGFDQLRSK